MSTTSRSADHPPEERSSGEVPPEAGPDLEGEGEIVLEPEPRRTAARDRYVAL